MKKNKLFLSIFSAVFLLAGAGSCFAQLASDTLTVTTYYPAPFAEYRQLRLTPQSIAPDCNAGVIGGMYYNTNGQMYTCTASGWQSMGAAQYWVLSNNNLMPASTAYNVAVGTASSDSTNRGSFVIANKYAGGHTVFDDLNGNNIIVGKTHIADNTGGRVLMGDNSIYNKVFVDGGARVTGNLTVNGSGYVYGDLGFGSTARGLGRLHIQANGNLNLSPRVGIVNVGSLSSVKNLCLGGVCRNTWPQGMPINGACVKIWNDIAKEARTCYACSNMAGAQFCTYLKNGKTLTTDTTRGLDRPNRIQVTVW